MHVDVKKLGNIPDGGGWRYVGRRQGEKHRVATPGKSRNAYGGPKLGYAFVHTIIDDHSRVAYTEIHDDETAVTAVGVLHRAVEWFAERGVTIERVLSDNGGAYRSYLWRDTCGALSITPKFTRPYRPQTNGKVERFHRTMADGWAYARCYTSEQQTPRRFAAVATPLQPAPPTHRLRQPAAVLTVNQRPRSVHLAGQNGSQGPDATRGGRARVTPARAEGPSLGPSRRAEAG